MYCILLFVKRDMLYIFAWRIMHRRLTGPMEELGLQAGWRETFALDPFVPLVSPTLSLHHILKMDPLF